MVDTSPSPASILPEDAQVPDFKRSESLDALFAWLDAPQPENPADQLLFLQTHLATLHVGDAQPVERVIALQNLFTRATEVVRLLLPGIVVTSLPVPKKTRRLVRSMQDVLRSLADDLMDLLPVNDTGWIDNPQPAHELGLWQAMYAISLHLRLSMLIAAPPIPGIWQQLHQAYEVAFLSKISRNTPRNAPNSLQDLYFATVLTGCVQPSSFNSIEVNFIASYFDAFSNQIHVTTIDDSNNAPSTFWVNPQCDSAAFACNRKLPPPHSNAYYFSCLPLANLIQEHLKLLESGYPPKKVGLPEFAATLQGLGVLRRLVGYIGHPAKRRFPRRRQKSRRATLCVHFDSIWRLFQEDDETLYESSLWMVINESPDGLALMHLSGKTGSITVGDLAAIRFESENTWQVCIVRWAASESQENIEIGLQILADQATPTNIALQDENKRQVLLSALLLPCLPNAHPNEMLIAPSGSLQKYTGDLVLVIEKGNVEIREVRKTSMDEQNSLIEIFSIESQEAPPAPTVTPAKAPTDTPVAAPTVTPVKAQADAPPPQHEAAQAQA
ncbi:MAG: hypothetical protein LBM17_03185 [Candidatus Accumulibacter sp.]|jgi:hypothetical protein|nr:hypothetical protein [Accumulibacter sp.]